MNEFELMGCKILFIEYSGTDRCIFHMDVNDDTFELSYIDKSHAIQIFKTILLQKYNITDLPPIVFLWGGYI